MGNVSDNSCRENQNMFIANFFFETLAFCEIMWKNMLQPDRLQVTMWYDTWNLHAGWLRLQTHTEYVLLMAFVLQH